MDFLNKFQIKPFPIEKEFRIQFIKQRLHELTREELEEFLTESLSTMTKLAHQVTELRNYLEQLEGKKE
jgi:hypothetical protein